MRLTPVMVFICALLLPYGIGRAEAPAPLVSITINGHPARFVSPVMRGGSVMVRCKDFEKIGWARYEKRNDGSALLRSQGVTITLTPGSRAATVNKLPFTMKQPALKSANQILAPLEFVCKALGYSCELKSGIVKIKAPVRTSTEPKAGLNSIAGRITYAGAAVSGIRLRLANRDQGGAFIKGYSAKSDAHGTFNFGGLPNGTYSVYAYIGDNPDFFNRMSEKITLSEGTYAKVRDICMGRILQPASPKRGGSVAVVDGKISLTCTACPTAAKYRFAVLDSKSRDMVCEATSANCSVDIAASDLEPGREYVWQVQSMDASGEFLGGSPGCGPLPWTFKVGKK
jgi:hypothetical protein